MLAWPKTSQAMLATFAAALAIVATPWQLGLSRLVFSDEPAPIHARIEALEQFNRDTRLPVLEQARWRANPLGMLWPETDAAFVTSGAEGRWPRRGGRW